MSTKMSSTLTQPLSSGNKFQLAMKHPTSNCLLLHSIMLLILVAAKSSSCDESVSATLISLIGNDEAATPTTPTTHEHHPTNSKSNGNLWEMVASMGPSSEDSSSSLERGDFAPECGYDFGLTLDQANRFKLDWTYDYNENSISFALNLNVTSWPQNHKVGADIFALGFSERGQLENSDFCLIWYDLAQKMHLQDARIDENKHLELIDETRSICRLRATSDVDEATARVDFSRPLDACSPRPHEDHHQQYYAIDNGTTHLLWFSIKGPVLSLNGLDVGLLEESSQKGRMLEAKLNAGANSTAPIITGRFEWAMKRVQLIANKRPLNCGRSSGEPRQRSSTYHHHDVHMEAVQIPARETTYWCKLLKLPEMFSRRKHHIVKYGPLITRGNGHIVHHMELFNCVNLSPGELSEMQQLHEGQSGWSGECESPRRPAITRSCKRVILAWAMGAKTFEYPAEVGQAIGRAEHERLGGAEYSPYVMLEVHYNNVAHSAGLMDFSGLRFYYTSRLRQFDAGILEVGLEYTPKNSVPPLRDSLVPVAGTCTSECTRVALVGPKIDRNNNNDDRQDFKNVTQLDLASSGGIYVFGAQMHTHLRGVASWTEHWRGAQLIGELQRDDHYSPHFQEIRLLPERRYLAPGDALRHYCLYDTRSARNSITLGGFSTQDEMCVTYLHYYPRKQLEVCKSSIDTHALNAYFAYLAREESQQTTNLDDTNNTDNNHRYSSQKHNNGNDTDNGNENENGKRAKSVGENYQSVEWSRRRSLELLELYEQAPLSVQCNRSNGARFPGFWDQIPQHSGPQVDSTRAPFEAARAPSGAELAAYRGAGFRRRHAQCASRQNLQFSQFAPLAKLHNSNYAKHHFKSGTKRSSTSGNFKKYQF